MVQAIIAGGVTAAIGLAIGSLVMNAVILTSDGMILVALLTLLGSTVATWHVAKSGWAPPEPTATERRMLPWAILSGIVIQLACYPLTAAGYAAIVPTSTLLTLGILFPISEEVFFRGWLWKKMPWPAVTTTFLFALSHVPMWGWARASLLIIPAIAFALWRKRSGGVFAGIAAHVAFNLTGLLIP